MRSRASPRQLELLPRGAAEAALVRERAADQGDEILCGERLEAQQEGARQQRGDDGERRVLRRGRDERHQAVLHRREQHVLLRLREAVHLVDEQHRRMAPRQLAACALQLGADLLDAGGDRRQLHEAAVGGLRHHGGDGGLAHPGRSPQEHRHRLPVGEAAQRRPGREEVLLPDDLIQRARPQPHGERRLRVRGVAEGSAARGGRRIRVAEQVEAHRRHSSDPLRPFPAGPPSRATRRLLARARAPRTRPQVCLNPKPS